MSWSLLIGRKTSKWSLWDVVFHENYSIRIITLIRDVMTACAATNCQQLSVVLQCCRRACRLQTRSITLHQTHCSSEFASCFMPPETERHPNKSQPMRIKQLINPRSWSWLNTHPFMPLNSEYRLVGCQYQPMRYHY